MNPTVYAQLPGDAGIMQTVSMMRQMVNASFLNPLIRDRAASLIGSCNRDPDCEDRMLLSYVVDAMQYVRDPAGVEALHDPVTFVERKIGEGVRPYGDCDDMSIYLATLLKAVGHRPRFRVLSRHDDGSFHHILVWCHDKNLDATMQLGREPENPTRAIQIEI